MQQNNEFNSVAILPLWHGPMCSAYVSRKCENILFLDRHDSLEDSYEDADEQYVGHNEVDGHDSRRHPAARDTLEFTLGFITALR